MIDELLVSCCAPTLAGLKTGSLFSCPYESRNALLGELSRLNRLFRPRALRLIALRFGERRALLYLYRPAALERDLSCRCAREILAEAGYGDSCCGSCLQCLIRRLHEGCEFPHEIGLFLSYPPDDVRGFIDNKARNFKLSGQWKVFGDEEKALALFEKYKKCTRSYCAFFRAGFGVERLAVAS